MENKFISDYEVFEKCPSDESLVGELLERHEKMFGRKPTNFTADKGFYESREQLADLRTAIPNVSIAKKGGRTLEEMTREHDPIFRALQRFRAGIEGTISYLMRIPAIVNACSGIVNAHSGDGEHSSERSDAGLVFTPSSLSL